MKKMTAMALTTAMVMAMGTAALAAPSVQGGDEGYEASLSAGNAELGDDAWVQWDKFPEENLANYSEETQTLIKYVEDLEKGITVKQAFEDFYGEKEIVENLIDGETIKLFDTESGFVQDGFEEFDQLLFLSPIRELTFHNIEPTEENPVEVDFRALDMTEDMEVYVLYRCEEHGWELLETERTGEEQDKQVTASFHAGDSLAALVYLDKSVEEESEGTSPRT